MKKLLSIVFVAVFGLVLLLQGRADETPAAPLSLRVLTYNIHHGEGEDGKLDLPRLAAVIKALNPDLVALQEVDNKAKRTGGVDQAAELGKLTGMHAIFGKAMDFQGGQYGEAVLSRFPILKSETHALPADKGYEPRAMVEVRVRPREGGPFVRFLGTHLDHTDPDKQRQSQADTILKILLPDKETPMVLVGDFNAEPDSMVMKKFFADFSDALSNNTQPTYPADKPNIRIDYILLRPAARFRVVETRVIEEKVASDHRPVLAVVELIP